MRIAGIVALAEGLLLLLPFFTTRVNPNVGLADGAMLVIALGGLMVIADSFTREVHGRDTVTAYVGWCCLFAGLLIALAGFLLGSQVACSCPAEGPCACGDPLNTIMVFGGIALVLVGGTALDLLRRQRGRSALRLLGAALIIVGALLIAVGVLGLIFPYFPPTCPAHGVCPHLNLWDHPDFWPNIALDGMGVSLIAAGVICIRMSSKSTNQLP